MLKEENKIIFEDVGGCTKVIFNDNEDLNIYKFQLYEYELKKETVRERISDYVDFIDNYGFAVILCNQFNKTNYRKSNGNVKGFAVQNNYLLKTVKY